MLEIKQNARSLLFFLLFLLSLGLIVYGYKRYQVRKLSPNAQVLNSKTKNIMTTEYAIIPVKTVAQRNKTIITIPFIPPKERVEVWLSLRLNNELKQNMLMSHADLNKLDWDHVGNDSLTLFQKSKTFDNIDDFIQNPPLDKKIEADPDLIITLFQNNPAIKPLSAKIDLENTDYILTTYRPFYTQNQWSVFKTTIDATDAFVDKDSMFMEFLAKGISETNPFIFEQVYIDY